MPPRSHPEAIAVDFMNHRRVYGCVFGRRASRPLAVEVKSKIRGGVWGPNDIYAIGSVKGEGGCQQQRSDNAIGKVIQDKEVPLWSHLREGKASYSGVYYTPEPPGRRWRSAFG
jgi:hypothetical protein